MPKRQRAAEPEDANAETLSPRSKKRAVKPGQPTTCTGELNEQGNQRAAFALCVSQCCQWTHDVA